MAINFYKVLQSKLPSTVPPGTQAIYFTDQRRMYVAQNNGTLLEVQPPQDLSGYASKSSVDSLTPGVTSWNSFSSGGGTIGGSVTINGNLSAKNITSNSSSVITESTISSLKYPITKLSKSNNWVDYGSGNPPLSYCQNKDGVVFLQGLVGVNSSTRLTGTVATLPTEVRPANPKRIIIFSYTTISTYFGNAFATINTNGAITIGIPTISSSSTLNDKFNYFSFDGVCYIANT